MVKKHLTETKPNATTDLNGVLTGKYLYAWRRGKVWLYIGISKNVGARISGHPIIGRTETFQTGDFISYWNLNHTRLKEGFKIESEEINFRNPKYNKQINEVQIPKVKEHFFDPLQPVEMCPKCNTWFFRGAFFPLCDLCGSTP